MPNENTPPLQSSPAFQERQTEALGGQPINPVKFQQVSASPNTGSQAAPAGAPKPTRRTNSTFDVDRSAEEHRAKINNARAALSNLILNIDTTSEQVSNTITALRLTKEGKEEAARQGFDLDVAAKFLDALDKTITTVKPKQ